MRFSMKLKKSLNRVYNGTPYYRWLVTLPPSIVKELGWDETTELKLVKTSGKIVLKLVRG